MDKILVSTKQKEYSVFIDNFSPGEVVKLLKASFLIDHYFVIADANVNRLHKIFIDELILLLGKNTNHFILKSGEKSKSFLKLSHLLKSMHESGLSRSSSIIAIGGGVVGDLSAFAASIYLRGIKLIHLPTSLISAVDSSVGGKTGINFMNIKNTIGTFYQPDCVIVNPPFFKTLPHIEINSGLGEISKYTFLSDELFFNYVYDNTASIKSLDDLVLRRVIHNCLLIKSAIVQQDESERGARKILNLGHTFGHAFESASNFRIKHGIAVNAGLIIMLIISKNLNILNEDRFNSYIKLPIKNSLPHILLKISDEELLYYIKFDKKNYNGQVNSILIKDIGEILIDFQLTRKQILKGFSELKEFLR